MVLRSGPWFTDELVQAALRNLRRAEDRGNGLKKKMVLQSPEAVFEELLARAGQDPPEKHCCYGGRERPGSRRRWERALFMVQSLPNA